MKWLLVLLCLHRPCVSCRHSVTPWLSSGSHIETLCSASASEDFKHSCIQAGPLYGDNSLDICCDPASSTISTHRLSEESARTGCLQQSSGMLKTTIFQSSVQNHPWDMILLKSIISQQRQTLFYFLLLTNSWFQLWANNPSNREMKCKGLWQHVMLEN